MVPKFLSWFRCCLTIPQAFRLKHTDPLSHKSSCDSELCLDPMEESRPQSWDTLLFSIQLECNSLHIASNGLILYVFKSGPWSHGVGNQTTECRNRGAGSHSTWDHARPYGCCSHWKMTPASCFQQSLREATNQYNQPPFMVLWCYFGTLECFCIIWRYSLSILYTLLSTLDIFSTACCNIKGFCGVFSRDAALQDRSHKRLGEEKVGGTLRDTFKHHCYVWNL